MKPNEVKVGDWAVSKNEDCHFLTLGKKYKIVAVTEVEFAIIDNEKEIFARRLNSRNWTFEPGLTSLNTQSVIVEVTTKVLVTFEKTQIENGEEYLIKTIELADMPDLRKEVEYQVRNLANPQADDIIIKWENQ